MKVKCIYFLRMEEVCGMTKFSHSVDPLFVSVIFFFVYLLSHDISRKIRKSLILLCEVHFALLYVLQIDLISNALEQKDSLSIHILMQLGKL